MNRATAARLSDPAPDRETIDIILAAAARAPDHGRLEPWRFVVLEGEARSVLANAMETIARADGMDDKDRIAKARDKAFRAPTVIVVAGVMRPEHKVPEVEQLLAVGAAIENMLIAAEALGLGSMWKTGAPAYDADLKVALGLTEGDHICGFVYLGQTASEPRPFRARTAKVVWLEPARGNGHGGRCSPARRSGRVGGSGWGG